MSREGPPPELLELLASLGYRLTWTDLGGGACILRRGHERWLGHGPTRGEALQDALAAALPSHLGERLLARALESRHEAAAPLPAHDGPVAEPPPAPRVPARADASLVPRPPAPKPDGAGAADSEPDAGLEPGRGKASAPVAEPEAPKDPGPPGSAERGDARMPRELPFVISRAPRDAARPPAEKKEPATPQPPQPPKPRLTRQQAHASLDRILEAIEQSLPDLATATAPRQRLQLTAWMAEARALEEALPGEAEVHDRVTATAQRLGRLTKLWWPGTTRVLFVDATPALCCGDLFHETCGSWWDLVERIEATLTTEQPRQADGRPIDWCDDEALRPEPLDAAAQLAEAVAVVERLLGSLDEPPAGRPPVHGPGGLTGADERALTRAARRLRWIRESDVDSETWARAHGRLRWLQHDRRRDDDKALARVLDPLWRPPRSWAAELGEDPDQKRRRHLLRKLLVRRAAGELDDHRLEGWLKEALGLGAELPPRRLAALLHGVGDRVLALSADALELEDRGMRRRLRKLHQALEDIGPADAESERQALQAEVAGERPGAEAEEEAADAPADAPPFGSSAAAALSAALRSRVRGSRALFVSNRKDPAAWSELETLLELEVEGTVATPRRTGSACEAIAGGRHDFVLAATGFIGHSTEAALLDACRKSGATYVRTYKGRPLSILRALARELGVQPAAAALG